MLKKNITIHDAKSEEKKKEPKIKPKKPPTPKVYKPYVPKYEVKAEGNDATNFDFAAQRPPGEKATFTEAWLHLVSNSLGALLVCLNELYVRNGLIGSMLTNVLLSCIMSYCLYSITKSAHAVYGVTQVSQMTYPDLAQATMDISSFPELKKYGGKFKSVVVGFIVARYIAKCCVYQIVLARSLHYLIHKQNFDPDSIRITLLILFLPLLLICMLRSTEFIAPFYYVSHVFISLLFVYLTATVRAFKAPKSFMSYPIFSNTTSFFNLIGGCAFTMDTSSAILTIENNMEEPKKVYLVIVIGMAIMTIVTVAMSVFGAYGWGYAARAPIPLNIDKLPYAKLFTKSFFFSTYLSYSIEFWVFFNLIWIYLKRRHREEKYWIFERLYRAGIFLAITLVAIALPDLSGLLSFFGALIVGVLNFIFPPVIEFIIDVRHKGFGRLKWKLIRLVAITSFGLIVIIGGAISSVVNIG